MTDVLSNDELTLLGRAVRRVARARGADASTADDVAQETVARLLTAGDRLEPDARMPWALVTAGNLLVSLHREADRDRRHQHRLLDRSPAAHPETDMLALEEAAAVRSALETLETGDRQLLLDHVEGASTIDLADAVESTPGAVAARLHRTRARMRLDYLLALRRVELPTIACRRVLLAISAADLRRQQALGTADHIAQCPTCADMVAPLARRSSSLAGIAASPLLMLQVASRRAAHAVRNHAVATTATTAAVAAAATGLVLSGAPAHKAAALAVKVPTAAATIRQQAPLRTKAGVALLPVPTSAKLRLLSGQPVVATGVVVSSVVSHPGFWIGGSNAQRMYVHIARPELIRQQILVGQRVTFVGVLRTNPANFAVADGVTGTGGAALLNAQGVHVEVDATLLRH